MDIKDKLDMLEHIKTRLINATKREYICNIYEQYGIDIPHMRDFTELYNPILSSVNETNTYKGRTEIDIGVIHWYKDATYIRVKHGNTNVIDEDDYINHNYYRLLLINKIIDEVNN